MEQNQVTRMKKIACTLLVDDNENTNFLHQMLLEDMGITEEILFAGNGLEAINLIQKRISSKQACPELILLDINMPVMDGFEFIEEFERKFLQRFPKTALFVLSSSVSENDKTKALGYQSVKGFLPKPLLSNQLEEIFYLFRQS